MHCPAGRSRQRSYEKITERRTGVRTTAFPTADHIIALGNKIGGAPEIEVRKRFAEIGHERLDVSMALTRRVQRILQKHVGSGELVNDAQVASLTPEIRKPTAYDGLVVLFLRHDVIPFRLWFVRSRIASAQQIHLYESLETLRFLLCNLLSCRVVKNDADCITMP